MNWLDISIIVIYTLGMLSLGLFFKDQNDQKDYFPGGKSFGSFAMGLSSKAAQLSALSFISASGFVGLKANGGEA